MSLDATGKEPQLSSDRHVHPTCQVCGEEITAFDLRHHTHEMDGTQSSVFIEKANNGTTNLLSGNDSPDDRAEIPERQAQPSRVDTKLDPGIVKLPSIRDILESHAAELEKYPSASPVHQNHTNASKELAEGLNVTGPQLPAPFRDEKRNIRFSSATDMNASVSLRERLHKGDYSSVHNSEFVDHRTFPPKVKKLYSTGSQGRWSEYPNAVVEEKELKRLFGGYDIVQRQRLLADEKDSGQSWETHSVIVRGQVKRTLQSRVFKKYPGMGDLNADELLLGKPFTPVVHRWKMLEELWYELPRPFGVETLRNILLPCVENQFATIERIQSSGLCSWADLNLILVPGEMVLALQYGVETAYQVTEVQQVHPQYGPAYWRVLLRYVDWNGQHCGYGHRSVDIMEFEGSRDVLSLEVVAFASLGKKDQIDTRAKLQNRGRKFEQLRGYRFKTCNGTRMVFETNQVTGRKERTEKPVNGRVIVDACAFYQCQDMVVSPLSRFDQSSQASTNNDGRKRKRQSEDSDSDSEAGSVSSSDRPSGATTSKRKKAIDLNDFRREEDFTPMTDEQCLLSSPFVKGMDLKSKEWSEFRVDEIEDIQWIDEIFEKLVLPPTHKKVALASARHRSSSMDMDFVPGKGRGLVLLMFGPPGVGKTLTAEAVAEKSRVPLYSMTAGELGTKASQLEKALTHALNCCTLWDAVLLLDEADIFLATRTVDNLERNELVSIFLRSVEHYQGVLFLTTNRMEVIDPAFQSRVDFILPYTGLTPEAREEVWRNLVIRAGTERVDLTDEDIRNLAKLNLNGREIKNLLKSAMLLDDKVSAEELHGLALMRVEAQKLLGIE